MTTAAARAPVLIESDPHDQELVRHVRPAGWRNPAPASRYDLWWSAPAPPAWSRRWGPPASAPGWRWWSGRSSAATASTTAAFHQVLMEDLELSKRLRRLGTIRIVPASVRVSGRRFLARPVLYTLAVNVLPALYAAGIPPAALKRLYGDPR